MESGADAPEQLVGVADAARRLDLTSQRVRQLAKVGALPPPVGRIGRQSVWRWRDIAVWAAATGRLPVEEAGGRQVVRAWLPGRHAVRVALVDAVESWGDGAGSVHVRVWEAPLDSDEPPVVVLGNLDDTTGQSVTNRIEDVAMEIGARHLGTRALRAQFYDHWAGGGADGQFHQVTFTVHDEPSRTWRQPGGRQASRDAARLLGATLGMPEWRRADRAEVEGLVGERVAVYLPGTYTAAMVRAVSESPIGRVGAVWDPGFSRATAEAALLLPADLPEQAAARAATARRALDEAARAAITVTEQSLDAPVWLVAPQTPEAEALAAMADESLLSDHDLLWRGLTWIRGLLSEADPEERRSLVSSVRPGWARLAWHEAGIPEPDNPRDGALGPVALPEDLLDVADQQHLSTTLTQRTHLQLVEAAVVGHLAHNCAAYEAWDVPAARPAGPFRIGSPTVTRYLSQLRWHIPGRDNKDRTDRLAVRLGAEAASGADEAFDPDGNLVLRSADRRSFALEWPAVHRRRPDELAAATVRADPSRRTGAQPVFLELPEKTIVPLPSEPSWHPTHDYTWGYPGTGPENLARAVLWAVDRAVSDAGEDFRARAAETVHGLVRSGHPPSWQLRDVIRSARPLAAEGP